jgi:hypothetical protein
MDRKSGRALAKTTLEDLGVFDQVLQSEPDTFTAPITAVVHSKSLGIVQEARGVWSSPAEIFVTIYLRRVAGGGDDTEDLLDDLTRAAIRALFAAFEPLTDNLQIVSQAGKPERPIDGKTYRIERFAVRFNDDEE